MARNAVAGHYGNLASHMTLPGMLREAHVCRHCPHLAQCCLTHRYIQMNSLSYSLSAVYNYTVDPLLATPPYGQKILGGVQSLSG